MTHLVLRSPSQLGRAYILSPLAGMLTLWLCLALSLAGMPGFGLVIDLVVIPWFLIFGSLYCLVVELLVVAPLVAGFRRFGWRWVNTVSVAVIGFLTGVLPLTLLTVSLDDGRGLVAKLQGQALVTGALGLAGIVAAIAFRRIAMTPSDDKGCLDAGAHILLSGGAPAAAEWRTP